MYDEYKKDHVVPVTDADVLGSIAEKQQAAAGTQPEHKSKSGIVVKGMMWLCTSRSVAILFREMKSWALSQEAEASQSTGQTA